MKEKKALPVLQVTGRRKEAIARVRIRPGEGRIIVNRKPLEEYFTSASHRYHALGALRVADFDIKGRYDIDATINGGGISGQAGALRLGVARALIELDPDLKSVLKHEKLLTRDARVKESKKYGLKKARKAPQYSKR